MAEALRHYYRLWPGTDVRGFIANCGMARVFGYLMETGAEITDQAVFTDTSRIIGAALERTYADNARDPGIAQRSFGMALRQPVQGFNMEMRQYKNLTTN